MGEETASFNLISTKLGIFASGAFMHLMKEGKSLYWK